MSAIIIGAGITGLATAYFLSRQGVDVTVIEKAPRPGGLLATFSTDKGDNLEKFYHHFFRQDAELMWLLKELDLQNKIIFKKTGMGVFHRQTFYPFDSIRNLIGFTAIPLSERIRFGMTTAMLTWMSRYGQKENTPALEWLTRWAGKPATEAIWEPLLRSKFGSHANEIPLCWIAGRIQQRGRSRSGGDEQLGYLAGSFQVLVDTLVEKLASQGVQFLYNCTVNTLLKKHGVVSGVETSFGRIQAKQVVATTPTPITANIVKEIHPDYAAELSRIEYLGVTCTLLSFTKPVMPCYWTNVTDSGFLFGGIIEHTRFIPPQQYENQHLVYLSNYLAVSDPLWTMDDKELIARQMNDLQRICGRDLKKELNQSWVFRARYAAPLTHMGFSGLIPAIRSPVPGFYTGCMPHVYPDERSTNNSIKIAASVAECMGYRVANLPKSNSLAVTYGKGFEPSRHGPV